MTRRLKPLGPVPVVTAQEGRVVRLMDGAAREAMERKDRKEFLLKFIDETRAMVEREEIKALVIHRVGYDGNWNINHAGFANPLEAIGNIEAGKQALIKLVLK